VVEEMSQKVDSRGELTGAYRNERSVIFKVEGRGGEDSCLCQIQICRRFCNSV